MSIVYFDSSAFVKLIVDEDGSELAAAVWDQRLRTGAHACGVRLAPREAGTG
jgi:predicted nucleic acid-binding protein